MSSENAQPIVVRRIPDPLYNAKCVCINVLLELYRRKEDASAEFSFYAALHDPMRSLYNSLMAWDAAHGKPYGVSSVVHTTFHLHHPDQTDEPNWPEDARDTIVELYNRAWDLCVFIQQAMESNAEITSA